MVDCHQGAADSEASFEHPWSLRVPEPDPRLLLRDLAARSYEIPKPLRAPDVTDE